MVGCGCVQSIYSLFIYPYLFLVTKSIEGKVLSNCRLLTMARLVLLLACLCAAALAQTDIECPFPEGDEVSSEVECAKYSSCSWSTSGCTMLTSQQIGYNVTSVADTTNGLEVSLVLMSDGKTMFGGDVLHLKVQVVQHADHHVQIKITDEDEDRYEVPIALNLPDVPDITSPLFTVSVSEVGQPFQLNVTRLSTGLNVFEMYGALTYEDQFIQLTTILPSTYLYGMGENTHQKLRHTFSPRQTWPIFARDQPIGTEMMNEYGHHPYYSVVEDDNGNTHSVLFYNSNAMEYSTFLTDEGKGAMTLRTIGGIVDLHFFLGPYPEDVNEQYIATIGTPIHPPYWFLGFQLSRWGYTSPDHIREVRARMKAAGIPQDVQTVDIDYMERYRDFTYDRDVWADLPALIDELHSDNVKVVLILDPALVIDWDNYLPSQRGRDKDVFIKWMSQDLVPADQPDGALDYMVGYVWPDMKTVFPDFLSNDTATWWASELSLMRNDLKYDAIWIDMNEPANFGTDTNHPWNWPANTTDWSLKCPDNELDSPPYPTKMVRVGGTESKRISDHTLCMSALQTDGEANYTIYNTHSLYGHTEARATYRGLRQLSPGKRVMAMSRSTFPGTGQYAVHWLGDNSADWTQMRMSIIGMIEFNMFGIPTVGADICGFFNVPDTELCVRWQQLGAMYPFSRNHNAEGNPDQDPAVDPTVAEHSKVALEFRYAYLPYLYFLFHKASMHGGTVVRPLYNEYPTDIIARDIDQQFMLGSAWMVAPVLYPGITEQQVYFPEGLWYHIYGGALVSNSSGYYTQPTPLSALPMYVRGGHILPRQTPALNTVESRQNNFGLTIVLDEFGYAAGNLFWDDGESDHAMETSYMSSFTFQNNTLTTSIKHGEQMVAGLTFASVNIYGVGFQPEGVTVNGAPVAYSYTQALAVELSGFNAPLDVPLSVVMTPPTDRNLIEEALENWLW